MTRNHKLMAVGAAVLMIMLAVILSGCGEEKVSATTLEDARAQARANALENAQTFRAEDPRFAGLEIIARGDSTQARDCPQGDGWASIDFFRKGTQVFSKVKCSTFSRSLGCMTEEDFQKRKQYASQEGNCNPDVPPTIGKLTQ